MSSQVRTLDIHVARSDGQVLVRLAGELDLMSCGALSDRLSGLAPTPRTVLDMSDVTFMDSTGLRALWLFQQLCEGDGSHLVLQSPSTPVLRVLELTGMQTTFEIAE
jgi:anti-anti-sigma factor